MWFVQIFVVFLLANIPLAICEGEGEGEENASKNDGSPASPASEKHKNALGEEHHKESGHGLKVKKHVHEKVILCHQPEFYEDARCGQKDAVFAFANVADLVQLDIAKMPFKMDQWIHIDVAPTPEAASSKRALKFSHAYIQISDAQNRILGRVAEHLPCDSEDHPAYKDSIQELYRNPGLAGIEVYNCDTSDTLDHSVAPTVVILHFKPEVTAFYVNMKFTLGEAKMIQGREGTKQETIAVTTLLLDDKGACYFHRVSPLKGLPKLEEEKDWGRNVPIPCHAVGPAFEDSEGKKSPLKMSPMLKVSFSNITFLSGAPKRPKSGMVDLGSAEYRKQLQKYNNVIYNVDSQGYLPGEKERERNKKPKKVSEMRRPAVPLMILPDMEAHDNDTTNTTANSSAIANIIVTRRVFWVYGFSYLILLAFLLLVK